MCHAPPFYPTLRHDHYMPRTACLLVHSTAAQGQFGMQVKKRARVRCVRDQSPTLELPQLLRYIPAQHSASQSPAPSDRRPQHYFATLRKLNSSHASQIMQYSKLASMIVLLTLGTFVVASPLDVEASRATKLCCFVDNTDPCITVCAQCKCPK
jgi:hypothetical protein